MITKSSFSYTPRHTLPPKMISQSKSKIFISDEDNKIPRISVGTRLYNCDTCIFSTTHERNLKLHMRRHNPESFLSVTNAIMRGTREPYWILIFEVFTTTYGIAVNCVNTKLLTRAISTGMCEPSMMG